MDSLTLEDRLLSIWQAMNQTCEKAGSSVQPNAVGQVYFFDPDEDQSVFECRSGNLRLPNTELKDLIEEGWTPFGFILTQSFSGKRELHSGLFHWCMDSQRCQGEMAKRLEEFLLERAHTP